MGFAPHSINFFHGKLGSRCQQPETVQIFPSIVSLRRLEHFLREK